MEGLNRGKKQGMHSLAKVTPSSLQNSKSFHLQF
jgi:hypothetical protein